MFGIGIGELFILVLIVLLINDPVRLPELARTFGKYVRDFRRITDEVKKTVEREINRIDEPTPPSISPPAALPPPKETEEKKNGD